MLYGHCALLWEQVLHLALVFSPCVAPVSFLVAARDSKLVSGAFQHEFEVGAWWPVS